MTTSKASFKASIPNKISGASHEFFYEISGEEKDFGVPSINGPVITTTTRSGCVDFYVTIRMLGTFTNVVKTETILGKTTDFGQPAIDGPVIVVEDPPKFKAAEAPAITEKSPSCIEKNLGFEIDKAA